MFTADKNNIATDNYKHAARLDGKKLYIGIVQARFNASITQALFDACMQELQNLGVQTKHITHVSVPGALEIPCALQALAQRNEFDALIALGCIIRGETYHFELVANESGAGVTRVALDYKLPIANAILTVENMQQAIVRQSVNAKEAARVAVEMANLINELA